MSKCLSNAQFELIEGDITDSANIFNLLIKYSPDVIYNAAAQSHVHTSFEQPLATWKITAEGHLNLLEAVRQIKPSCQVVFFASSEMFGNNSSVMFSSGQIGTFEQGNKSYQDESTPFSPQSPYSIAKLAAFNTTRLYRESYKMNCFSAIMFNKESPRRGINFVTRKITSYFSNLERNSYPKSNLVEKLKLGNLKAYRDWSYVPDVMLGLVDLAESIYCDDYVFCTGETHTIEEFLDEVSKYYNLDWKEYVEIDKTLFRPAEVNYLCGDATKIYRAIGWQPKVKFKELVRIMCEQENGEA